MITEDYVSFEIAKLLKEKGFNEKCRRVYYSEGKLVSAEVFMEGESFVDNEDINYATSYYEWNPYALGPIAYLCPTTQIAVKWLEVEHKLLILKDYVNTMGVGFWYQLSVIKIKEDGSIDDTFESYCVHDKDYNNGCNRLIKHCLERL